MAQLNEVLKAQQELEANFNKKMSELQSQLQSAAPSKDTVSKVAEEFRTFREIMFSMLGIIRRQIVDCVLSVDAIEARHRLKVLIFSGIPEQSNEDCKTIILDLIQKKIGIAEINSKSIQTCHRLGQQKDDRNRPLLVRFCDYSFKSIVWNKKSALKGTKISVKEFLTKSRLAVFGKARQHFGMPCCWSQDGVVIVKTPDGKRVKIYSEDELKGLTKKFPQAAVRAEGKQASSKKASS